MSDLQSEPNEPGQPDNEGRDSSSPHFSREDGQAMGEMLHESAGEVLNPEAFSTEAWITNFRVMTPRGSQSLIGKGKQSDEQTIEMLEEIIRDVKGRKPEVPNQPEGSDELGKPDEPGNNANDDQG